MKKETNNSRPDPLYRKEKIAYVINLLAQYFRDALNLFW